MSAAAKEANLKYLGDLWKSYTSDVAQARGLSANDINLYSNNLLANLSNPEVNAASVAVKASLVDELKERQEVKDFLIEKFGRNSAGDNYKNIGYKKYLNIIDKPGLALPSGADKVAVVVAKGIIYNGTEKAGAIGGQSTSKLIRQARQDKNVKALVLRVDSPGGSAYASEVIRREILRTKAAGKPVIVSMGSYAASGGYWISASADEIWASPTTITGSIGIFGMLPTFEEPLNKLGIYRDGVGTTNLSGAFDAGKPLRQDVSNAIQNSIENGYNRFLNIVAEGRNMTKEDVDKIAQGRVWSGATAHELGLIDELGGIDKAIESAANKAGLVSYETKYIERKLSESERLIKEILDSAVMSIFGDNIKNSTLSFDSPLAMISPTVQMMQQLQDSFQSLLKMDDPEDLYAHCLCDVK